MTLLQPFPHTSQSVQSLTWGKVLATVCATTLWLFALHTPAVQAATAPAPAQQQQSMPPEAAFALLAGEAEKGNSGAMLSLGSFYERGVGVARNYSKAFEWYEKAAKSGKAEGWFNMGVCHEIGMGVSSNIAKAVECYQKAADMGLALAMYKISALYINGNGIAKNPAKGIEFLNKAANAGMPMAANELGLIHLSGLLGQKKDGTKALEMFNKSAEMGNMDAVRNLAAMYKDGNGVKANPALAYTWYLIARRGGYTGEDVLRMLGLLEGSLPVKAAQKAQKDAASWIEKRAPRPQGS